MTATFGRSGVPEAHDHHCDGAAHADQGNTSANPAAWTTEFTAGSHVQLALGLRMLSLEASQVAIGQIDPHAASRRSTISPVILGSPAPRHANPITRCRAPSP